MIPFSYVRATGAQDAIQQGAASGAKFLGGGTNLVDLMREAIERPTSLMDVTGLSSAITERPDGGLIVGAAVRNTALAENPLARRRFPVLTRVIVAGASAQIRNMALAASPAADTLRLFL